MPELHLEDFIRQPTRPPKYSCRDCWTGVYPMENQQQEPEVKPLWGLKKVPLTTKPKEKRILETVNRMITRIQTTKERCLWENTPTRPAWECRYPSRRIWPPSVTSITSMNQTWWDVQSYGSWRTFNKTQTRPHGICFYKGILGHPSDMTFLKTLLIPLTGSFSIHLKKDSKKILLLCSKSAIYRLHILMCQYF